MSTIADDSLLKFPAIGPEQGRIRTAGAKRRGKSLEGDRRPHTTGSNLKPLFPPSDHKEVLHTFLKKRNLPSDVHTSTEKPKTTESGGRQSRLVNSFKAALDKYDISSKKHSNYVIFLEKLQQLQDIHMNRAAGESAGRKEDVEIPEFLKLVAAKEDLNKMIGSITTKIERKRKELEKLHKRNQELEDQLAKVEEEFQELTAKEREHEQKKENIEKLKVQLQECAMTKESLLRAKTLAEDALDSTNAEIATQTLIKKVVEAKLEEASLEKEEKIMRKVQMMEEREAIKEQFTRQLEQLTRQKQNQVEIYNNGQQKVKVLQEEKEKLEQQLGKAKDHVSKLIQEIGKWEAKAAIRLKAEKKAKEAAKDSKTKWPTGTVTIAFSDVQSSTTQWEKWPVETSQAMEVHNSILRENLKITGGYEVKTEGDSFMVAFHSPISAVWWCLFVQEALMVANWPSRLMEESINAREEYDDESGTLIFRGLRVRMGIHMGKPECRLDPVTGRMDYFGGMVNRAARITGIACGGQIFVSGVTWEAAKRELDMHSVHVEYLGQHYLKGLKSGEQIVQILPRNLQARRKAFPLLVTNMDNPIKEQEAFKFQEYKQDEAVAESEYTAVDDDTTEKLAAIVNEIDATLKAQQERQEKRAISKEIVQLEIQIKDVQELINQAKADEDLLKYQVHQKRVKNELYNQDIVQTRADKEVALDLIEGFEKEKMQANAVIISANAKAFCLLIRQNLLEGQTNRLIEEVNLYEKQIQEVDEEQVNSVETQILHMKERISLLENQLAQTKQESDFYIKQVQDLEKGLRAATDLDFTSLATWRSGTTSTTSRGDHELDREEQRQQHNKTLQLLHQQRELEQTLKEIKKERDTEAEKVKAVHDSISHLPEQQIDSLLKKVMELHYIKEEKEILNKQLVAQKHIQEKELEIHKDLLEKANQKVKDLTERRVLFEKRLARLTHKDTSISLEERGKRIAETVEAHLKNTDKKRLQQEQLIPTNEQLPEVDDREEYEVPTVVQKSSFSEHMEFAQELDHSETEEQMAREPSVKDLHEFFQRDDSIAELIPRVHPSDQQGVAEEQFFQRQDRSHHPESPPTLSRTSSTGSGLEEELQLSSEPEGIENSDDELLTEEFSET